jgi:methionyl-tRNA formyltransferase
LLPKLSEHRLSLFFTRKSSATKRPTALNKLAEFETQTLAQLNVKDNNGGIKSIEQLHSSSGQKIDCLNDVNESDFVTLQACQADLIISIRHMTILKENVIDLPHYGVINLHSGNLPSYQGVMASFWAMLQEENSLATTLHCIDDAKIDTGAIIEQSMVNLQTDKSYLWNVLNLYDSGCKSILRTIGKMGNGNSVDCAKQNGPANYFSYPKQSDIDQFNKLGWRLFDLTDPTDFGFR